MTRKNIPLILMLVIVGMLGLAFASVPLYRLFCKVTGYEGTARKGDRIAEPYVTSRSITMRFDANISKNLPWDFYPKVATIDVPIGSQPQEIFYIAKNRSHHKNSGQAVYTVVPHRAAPYFYKIDCFCFTEQTLDAAQEREMSVVFYVDPSILENPDTKDIDHITLSYTFYPLDDIPVGASHNKH